MSLRIQGLSPVGQIKVSDGVPVILPIVNSLVHTVNNPTPEGSDYFAKSVAIDGSYAVIGAWRDSTAGTVTGSVYVYNVTTGALEHTITNPTPVTDDRFGEAVAISGNYVIIGCRGDDPGVTNGGSAYIYDVTTGTIVHTLVNPSPVIDDDFGYSVSISGNYAIVGANYNLTGGVKAGSAYIYDVTTGNLLWTINNPTPAANDAFGWSVAITDTHAIISATSAGTGEVYIYDVSNGNLIYTLSNPTPQTGDSFGYSLSADGDYLVVGTRHDNTNATNAGSVYVYQISSGTLLHTINNPTPISGDIFGHSVSISGSNILVGAPNDDTGATNAGSAYVYDVTTGNLLHTINNPNPDNDDWFGDSVGISNNNIIIGAYFDDTSISNGGTAYIYN